MTRQTDENFVSIEEHREGPEATIMRKAQEQRFFAYLQVKKPALRELAQLILYDRAGSGVELAVRLNLSIQDVDSLKKALRRATEEFRKYEHALCKDPPSNPAKRGGEVSRNKYRGSVPEEIWAALDADQVQMECRGPAEIEALPIADVKDQCVGLGLTPSMPEDLQKTSLASAPSQTVDLLGPLAEDEEWSAPQYVEKLPLAEVTANLQQLGINYRTGVAEILNLVRQHTGSRRVKPDSDSALLYGRKPQVSKARFGFTPGLPEPAPRRPSVIADRSESHVLVVAPTGAGKGRNYIIPNLLSSTASFIVLDIKGEAARVTARRRRELGQEVVILDPFHVVTDEPDSLNPLQRLVSDPDTVADEAFMLASLLSEGARSTRDAFWDDLGECLLTGLFTHVATTEGLRSRALGDVWNLLAADDFQYATAVLLDTKSSMHPFAKQQLAGFLAHEADKVQPSVLSTAKQHMRIFASERVQRAVARTSFDLDKVRSGAPMTIFIVVPPTKLVSHGSLIRLWLATLLGVITERTERPARPTIFMVDELAQLGGLRAFKEAVTLLRGYGLRCCLFLQSHAQLKSLYPHDHETITENCGAIVTFGHTSMGMSRPIADLLGDVSADTLFGMTRNQLAVRMAGEPTVIARRLDYLTDSQFAGKFDPNPRYR
jgi:type IV secretion system protein VirD4